MALPPFNTSHAGQASSHANVDTAAARVDLVMTRQTKYQEGGTMSSSIFARIGMIKGESQDAKHKDEIDLLSWSWGIAQPDTVAHGGGGGAGKAHVQDLSFTDRVDKASPVLMASVRHGGAHQGGDDHAPQGLRRGPAGVPRHHDVGRARHAASRPAAAPTGRDRRPSPLRSQRSTWSTRRRNQTDRSMSQSTSSSTSRPTRSADARPTCCESWATMT